jgi:cytochrome c oxidase assembly protein subunit 15
VVTDVPNFARAAVNENSETIANAANSTNRVALENIEIGENAEVKLPPKWMSKWLFACAGLTFGVIVVGGVTRLTESGLSITEWKPITGVIPPLNDAMWQEEFQKYKATPEFKL